MNIRFDGPNRFEFTPELALFDAFDVQLLHGWLADPVEDAPMAEALKVCHFSCQARVKAQIIAQGLSYNQAVDVVISGMENEALRDRCTSVFLHSLLTDV